MSEEDTIDYSASDLPTDIPSRDAIVKLCEASGFSTNGVGIVVSGITKYWIKYGSEVQRGEALTQVHVAQIVAATPGSVVSVPTVYLAFLRERLRYIVMEYIDGRPVADPKVSPEQYKEDVKAVAAAVKQLVGIRAPADTQPGPVGGGFIGHDFFDEWLSTSEYPTVAHLQAQINTLVAPQGLSVDFLSETADGLVLCPADIDPSNFLFPTTTTSTKLYAIDFGHTGYLPPSYVAYSLTSPKPFTRRIARLVQYPPSANFRAMEIAAGLCLIYGNNSLGIESKVKVKRGSRRREGGSRTAKQDHKVAEAAP